MYCCWRSFYQDVVITAISSSKIDAFILFDIPLQSSSKQQSTFSCADLCFSEYDEKTKIRYKYLYAIRLIIAVANSRCTKSISEFTVAKAY